MATRCHTACNPQTLTLRSLVPYRNIRPVSLAFHQTTRVKDIWYSDAEHDCLVKGWSRTPSGYVLCLASASVPRSCFYRILNNTLGPG